MEHTMKCAVPYTGKNIVLPAYYAKAVLFVLFGPLTDGYYRARSAGYENRPGGPPTYGWRNGRVIRW